MLALGVLSAGIFLATVFLAYCFVGFGRVARKRRRPRSLLAKYYSPVTQHPASDRDNSDPKRFLERSRIAKTLVAGLSLAMPATLTGQSNPANDTAPAPLAAPAIVGPLSTASTRAFNAGPFRSLAVAGIFSGFGSVQDHSSAGDRAARVDISNVQVSVLRGVIETGFMF